MNKFLIPILIVVLGLPALIIFGFVDLSAKIDLGQVMEIIIFAVLVVVTTIYAERTSSIAKAAKKQAEEMREQRIMASRPVIIQRAVVETETELATFGSKDWFSYFEVYNAGNGPAIEVEISLLNKEKTPIHSQRKTFLRADEPPIQFSSHPIYPEEPTF